MTDREIINATLRELPVGNIQTHTPDSIPERVAYYVGEYARLERENAMLVADRDSWCEQAEQRTIDAVEAFARAERAERKNARMLEALIEARNMLSRDEINIADDLEKWDRAFGLLLPNVKVRDAASDSRPLDISRE